MGTVVHQIDDETSNADVDCDHQRENDRRFKSDKGSKVFKRYVFLLLNVN